MEILLKGRADPNVENYEARTPLHLALGKSLVTDKITKLLLKWRANVNKADKYGYTPLHIAASNELSQCVNLLIKHEADLTARTIGGNSALSIVLRKTPTSLDVFERKLDKAFELIYLNTFVKEGYKEILEHPLCQSFLYLKWHNIQKYYAVRLLFYLIYVLILTSWVIIALAHNCYNKSKGYIHNLSLCANATGIYGFLYKHPTVLEIHYRSVKQFFTQVENLVELCVILNVFATSFIYTRKTYTWQSYLGAFGVLCAWSNLMLMVGQLPVFGAYVALLLVYACLLIGFTVSFCVIFPRSKWFSSPHTGLIKVLAMMTGELDFDDFFFSFEKKRAFLFTTLCFVLFLLFVTIVLMNLLIGIAVHDIKDLQKTAGLAKLVRQTKLIYDMKIAIFHGFTPSKRFFAYMRWAALLLPSPLQTVLIVRPLNPREKTLPREVLFAAYKVAKEREGQNNFPFSHRKTYAATKTVLKADVAAHRCRGFDGDTLQHDCNKLKKNIAELRDL
ncbi:hypothetical protein PUN28_002163 [Cardiocondyla obscurior]|uniref:Ion transport domain-containing protein n=1 Tax=Cardiocondyla obscurior TaxID=286306 RepID=A0AAW2GSW9_9HYME